MRTQLLRQPPRALALAAFLLGFATASQAFTIITFSDPQVKKVSVGAPPADNSSETSKGPRYSVSDHPLACFIVFVSTAKNMVPGQIETNGGNDVFLYDCQKDEVVLVSHKTGEPLTTADGVSDQPVISPDGASVVFRSKATNIIEGGGFGGQSNIFVWDRVANTSTLVSHSIGGANLSGDGDSQNGVISRYPGRFFVAFESLAKDLVAGDGNAVSDVFRFDSATGAVIRVSAPNVGIPGEADWGSFNPALDGSGTCIVFESDATNLVSDDPADDPLLPNPLPPPALVPDRDVFRWTPGGTILLSHVAGALNAGKGAVAGSGASTEPSIADNCERFAFKSTAKDLSFLQADGNGVDDVFTEGNSGDAVLVSHKDGVPNEAGDDVSDSPILSRDGNWLAYASRATNLAPGQVDTASTSDVFVYDVGRNLNVLVSHTAGDPKRVASAESFAPEISTGGIYDDLYVAFESKAKDLDPNQNDSNGDSDVFLYNGLWNNAIVASRRFASIAITGKGRSIRPALSASGYVVAFTSDSGDLIADDPETGVLDDVFFFRSLGLMPFVSVRSTESQNIVEWITPPTNIVSMQAFVNPGAACPADYVAASAGTALTIPATLTSNESFQITDPSPADSDRCYSLFIERDSGPILPTSGPAQDIVAHTLKVTLGQPAKWASNVAGITSLAQVGIGGNNVIAVANDGGVYGLSRGPFGGTWSGGYRPFRTDFLPIQGRPGVVTLGSTRTVFVGSQDGRVYRFDADRGARAGGALSYTTPALGVSVQPGVAGMFTFFGGLGDHVLVGARSTAGPSQFFALDPATLLPRAGPLGTFSGGPFLIGAVSTTASVDYAKGQVYFASFKFSGLDPSLWCLKLTAGGLGSPCWTQTLPDGIMGGPVERNGTVYVGDNSGQIWAFDAALGTSNWGATPYTGCGGGAPIKSFVLADRQGTAQDLYYATSSELCAVSDQGILPTVAKWSIPTATIPGPSAPVLTRIGGIAYVFVGSSDGSLYQVLADDPFGTGGIKSVFLRTGATIGAPAFDFRDNMIYVGSDAGSIYAVQVPLP